MISQALEPLRMDDRTLATWCASSVLPGSDVPDAYDASDILRGAERFLDWLDEAETDTDRQARRVALVIACHQPSQDAKRVLTVARELHRWIGKG
jgi:hypothetical protein